MSFRTRKMNWQDVYPEPESDDDLSEEEIFDQELDLADQKNKELKELN
jgi:hypothetical protein